MERIISNLEQWPIVSDISIYEEIKKKLEEAKKN